MQSLPKSFYSLRKGLKVLREKKTDDKYKRVSSATNNMSALIDDIIKRARKNFKSTGEAKIDAKFLKESVSALKELYDLLENCDGTAQASEGVIIKLEKQLQEWSR